MKRYSISTAYFLKQKNQLPQSFWIGGRVLSVEKGELQLIGQGCLLRLPQNDLKVKEGDFLQLYILGSNLILEEQSGSLTRGHLDQYQEHEIRSGGQGEFKVPCGDIDKFRSWDEFTRRVRSSLESRGLEPVYTPSLVTCPGTEPGLEPFQTELKLEGKSQLKFLPTSPEIHLKKLMCNDLTDIYELKSCFRNGEKSACHEPEFIMLEWYRSFGNLESIKDDVALLFEDLANCYEPHRSWNGLEVLSVAELFAQQLNLKLEPNTPYEDLCRWARDLGVDTPFDQWEDVFNWIFVAHLEKAIPIDHPVLLHSYPQQFSALAKINEEGWADRFEIYYKGFEIGNAFNELTDPHEHIQRFNHDAEMRKVFGKSPVPLDQEFQKALEKGLPASAGIAVGMERLYMAFANFNAISEFKAFSS